MDTITLPTLFETIYITDDLKEHTITIDIDEQEIFLNEQYCGYFTVKSALDLDNCIVKMTSSHRYYCELKGEAIAETVKQWIDDTDKLKPGQEL